MNQTEKNFESKFFPEEIELLFLTVKNSGGAYLDSDNMYHASQEFIAALNLTTGEFFEGSGCLEWLFPKDKGFGYEFKAYQIYHVKCRKQLENPNYHNHYMLLKEIQDNLSDSRLETLCEKYRQPIYIKDEKAGIFTLNRDLSWFENEEFDWMGIEAEVSLETDEDEGETAEKAYQHFQKFYPNLKEWDERFRKASAEALTENANDWLQEDDENLDKHEITEQEFAERITIDSMTISPDGDFTVYYHDDDMFWGHVIEIFANMNGEIESIGIAG